MEDIEVFVACSRCGGMLPVRSQMLTNMQAEGTALIFAHADGQCPGETPEPAAEETPRRWFRLQLVVVETADDRLDGEAMIGALAALPGVVDVMGGAGHPVQARNVGEAVAGPLTAWLNNTWPKVQEEIYAAEMPLSSPEEPPSLLLPREPAHASSVRLILP